LVVGCWLLVVGCWLLVVDCLPLSPLSPIMQQLSIGNIVNLGVYLYRSHLKQYLKLAVIAHLWLLVPIYGYAQFYATSGLISRLAFCELINDAETLKTAKTHTNRQLWNFLIAGILTIFIPILGMLIVYIVFSIAGGLLYALLQAILGFSTTINPANPFGNLLFAIIVISIALVVYLSPLWFYARLFISELPLAIENEINSFKTINQSWQKTKNFRMRLIGIILLSFSITLPIFILCWLICSFLLGLILGFFPQLASNSNLNDFSIGLLLLIILSLVNGVITTPFWQAVKAVAYYDIRCRKEGFDLQFAHRDVSL
jgi:hypothetical protein